MNYKVLLVLATISLLVALLNVWIFYRSVQNNKNINSTSKIYTIQAFILFFLFNFLIIASLLNKLRIPSGFVLICGQVSVGIPILLNRSLTNLNLKIASNTKMEAVDD